MAISASDARAIPVVLRYGPLVAFINGNIRRIMEQTNPQCTYTMPADDPIVGEFLANGIAEMYRDQGHRVTVFKLKPDKDLYILTFTWYKSSSAYLASQIPLPDDIEDDLGL